MKRHLLRVLAAALAVLALAGCRPLESRTVGLRIPTHPWEEASGRRLWYDLVLRGKGFERRFHVNQDTRELAVEIPLGEPVVVLAYPLCSASPMGGWISPETGRGPVELSQRDGLVLEALARADADWNGIDYPVLEKEIRKRTDDFRKVDKARLAADAARGRLRRTSVVLNQMVEAEDLDLPSGIWVSEFWEGDRLAARLGLDPVAGLYPGEERFYCFDRNLMAVFTVGEGGASWTAAFNPGAIP